MKKDERTLTDQDLEEIGKIFEKALSPLAIKIHAVIHLLAENFVSRKEFENLKKRLYRLEERMYD